MKIEYLKPEELVPYKNNAKQHPKEQIEQIKESIRQFGFNDPIAIGPGNVIIEGHGRAIAAKELQMAAVPVFRLDQMTEEERRGYMLAHNQLTMNTGWDDDLLMAELGNLESFDMSLFGFDTAAVDQDPEVIEDDYYDTDRTPEARVQAGEVWILGDHRLMCGDSTDGSDMLKLMGGGEGGHGFHRSTLWRGDRRQEQDAAGVPEIRADH